MISSSIAFATNVGQYVAVKDTLVRTSNGIMRVKVDYYQYDNPQNREENFYRVEIDDTISLPPTEESYWPYSWNMGMKVLVEKFFTQFVISLHSETINFRIVSFKYILMTNKEY